MVTKHSKVGFSRKSLSFAGTAEQSIFMPGMTYVNGKGATVPVKDQAHLDELEADGKTINQPAAQNGPASTSPTGGQRRQVSAGRKTLPTTFGEARSVVAVQNEVKRTIPAALNVVGNKFTAKALKALRVESTDGGDPYFNTQIEGPNGEKFCVAFQPWHDEGMTFEVEVVPTADGLGTKCVSNQIA